VLIFSGALKIGENKTGTNAISGKIIIWGDLPQKEMSDLFVNNLANNGTYSVSYVEQKKEDYQQNLIEAFARGEGPDLFILSQDMILKNSSFIYKIPYASFPEKTFRTSYIDGADILLAKDGILGFPLVVNHLVLYYNKDMLSNESILYPPLTWDELFNLSDKLNKKKADGTIGQSMIAFGQYDNVNHAKDILSMLLLQSNNPIISRSDTGYKLVMNEALSGGVAPFEQIVNFYLEFSNPSNTSYSWNRAQPNSFDMFTGGKLAFYIGYASELFKIQSVNPNLSFDVTMVPQTKGTNIKRTYGDMHTLVINKSSKNLTSVFGLTTLISGSDFIKNMATSVSLPSMDRALLNEKPADPYLVTFFNSAIVARSWLDPDKGQTDSIFKEMIENSLSNKLSVDEAIGKATKQIELIVKSYDTKK
ncbi:extracellular solute-binding protein, partial [Candidatus Nomurabacteria bacterium]|nr:extracellular solute-binding protein [Candidatus Nomurabacteria bacterium]